MTKTLVIIPAFNEEQSLMRTIASLLAADLPADVLVVNDGSSDLTQEVAKRLPIYIIAHPVNLGYGAALQSGYKFALERGYLYVAQFDADGQHAVEDLKQLLEELRKNDADVVIGSRFLGNPAFHPGFSKLLVIRVFRRLIRLLTGKLVTDPTSGLRGLHERAFRFYAQQGNFPSDYPDADIIIHMLLSRFQLREFPISSRARTEGVSMHAGLRPLVYLVKVLLSILAVLLNNKLSMRRNRNV